MFQGAAVTQIDHRTVKGTTSLLDDTVRYWTPAGHMRFSHVSHAILSYTLCVQKFWTIVTWIRKERVVLVAKNFDILQGSQKDFHCKNKADDEPSEIFMLTSSGSLTRICPCSPLLPCTLSPWKYILHLGFITDLHFKSRGQIPEDSSGLEYDHRDFNPTNGIRMKRVIPSVLALSVFLPLSNSRDLYK